MGGSTGGRDDSVDSVDSLVREAARAPEAVPVPALSAGTILDETFRIERRLGAGGMGVVYLARDLRLDRDVAVKLHAAGRGAAGAEETLREAGVMARLSHPNVITVHHVGTFEGRVFLVMEYVDGSTLAVWLRERGRRWTEIVDAFVKAGRGLAVAHGMGLVHRDFKPENVLMGKDGRVRVADFGLARAADDAARGAGAGTPRYMSPEQRAGREVTAASDQYSFCVAFDEALREASPGASRVPGWVKRAIARGLEEDPARRWGSMLALLDRLVDARRRRRRAVSAGVSAAFAAAAIVAGALALRQAPSRPCQGTRDRLRTVWDDARRAQVTQAVIASGIPDGAATAQSLARAVDDYVAQWGAMSEDSCLSSRVRGDQSARAFEARAICLERGRAQLDETLRLLATADRRTADRALDMVRGLPAVRECGPVKRMGLLVPPTDDEATTTVVAEMRSDHDRLSVLWRAGGYEDLLAPAQSLVERARAAKYPPALAEALQLLGSIHIERHEREPAEAAYREAISVALAGMHDEVAIASMHDLAFSLARRDQFAEAEQWLSLATAMIARQAGHPRLEAAVEGARALLLARQGRFAEAESAARRAIELRGRLGEDWMTGQAHSALGFALAQAGRYDEARLALVEARAQFERALGADHPTTIEAVIELAQLDANHGEIERAAEMIEQARDVTIRRYGADDPRLANPLEALAYVRRLQGDPETALALLERTRVLTRRDASYGPIEEAETLGNIAIAQAELGRLEPAHENALASLAMFEKAFGTRSPRVVNARLIAGTLERYLGRNQESAEHLAAAHALAEESMPENHRDRVNARVELALTDLALGRPAEAVPLLEPAVAVLARADDSPMNLAEARFALARALWGSRGDRARARALATQARDGYAALGDGFAEPRTEIDAWLARHR